MESYKIKLDGTVQRQSDLALIPPTTDNVDYVRYLADKKDGALVTSFDQVAEDVRSVEAESEAMGAQEAEDIIQKEIRDGAIERAIAKGNLEIKSNGKYKKK